MSEDRTCLYRHFDRDERLLYVGISLNAMARQVAHAGQAPWFENSCKMTMEWFPTRAGALAAEARAIAQEMPLHNIAGRDNDAAPPLISECLFDRQWYIRCDWKANTLTLEHGRIIGEVKHLALIEVYDLFGFPRHNRAVPWEWFATNDIRLYNDFAWYDCALKAITAELKDNRNRA